MKAVRYPALFAALLAIVGAVPPATAQALASAHVIVAKDSKDPVLIWQASRDVYTLMGDGSSDKEINDHLYRTAIKLVAQNLNKLRSKDGTVSLKIMYNKMTANGLNYEVFTLANASEYANVQMPLKDARRNRDKWKSLSARAKIPSWIQVKVVGKLPGR